MLKTVNGGISADAKGIYGYGFTRYGEYGRPQEKFYWNLLDDAKASAAQIKLRQIANVNNIKDVYTCGFTSYALTTSSALYGWGLDFGLGYKTPHSWEPILIATNVKQFFYKETIETNKIVNYDGRKYKYTRYYLTNDDKLYVFGYINITDQNILHIIEPTLLADGVEDFQNGLLSLKPEGKLYSLYKGKINTDSDWPNKVAPKPMMMPHRERFTHYEPLRDTCGTWYGSPDDYPEGTFQHNVCAGSMTLKKDRWIVTTGFLGFRSNTPLPPLYLPDPWMLNFVLPFNEPRSGIDIDTPSHNTIWLQSDDKYIRSASCWLKANPNNENHQKYGVYKYDLISLRNMHHRFLFENSKDKIYYSSDVRMGLGCMIPTPSGFRSMGVTYAWKIPPIISTFDFQNDFTYIHMKYDANLLIGHFKYGSIKITGMRMYHRNFSANGHWPTYAWGTYMPEPISITNAYYAPSEELI